MKMNRQNPGGEEYSGRSMKGCEKYQAQGKGSVLASYAPGPMKKFDQGSRGGLDGMVKAGHIRNDNALTSTSGATVTGTSKASY